MLHLSLNPASMARQRQREDHERLQGECERLRGLVHALERGGPIPADLEAVSSLPSSKEVAGRWTCPPSGLWRLTRMGPPGWRDRARWSLWPAERYGCPAGFTNRVSHPSLQAAKIVSDPPKQINTIYQFICGPLIMSKSNPPRKQGHRSLA